MQRHMQQLISALRASQGDRDRGLLGQDWDRSLDVELSELQDLRRTKTGRVRFFAFGGQLGKTDK